MDNQLQNYILLKGVSDKFNEVAKEITEAEVKKVILETIKERVEAQISDIDFSWQIQEIVDDVISKNSLNIETMLKKSIERRLS